jgi:hypothetical protein
MRSASSACCDDVAIRTAELFYLTRRGQQVWHEKRGLDAG